MSKTAPLPPPSTNGSSSNAARWQAVFGCPPPQRLPSLVEQAIAWREQVLRHGDVSPAVAHDLQLAAEHALARRGGNPVSGDPSQGADGDLARTTTADGDHVIAPTTRAAPSSLKPPAPTSNGRTAALPPAASQLLPGSQLIKAHGGRNHVVLVEEAGFRYQGELFSSLSAIAKHITGTHWNGLLFFGLRKRRTYPPKPRRHG